MQSFHEALQDLIKSYREVGTKWEYILEGLFNNHHTVLSLAIQEEGIPSSDIQVIPQSEPETPANDEVAL